MEENSVVVMLDEEIARLRQIRTILQSLLAGEARVAPLLDAAAAEAEPDAPAAEAEPTVVRHTSRRGITTGRRGARRPQQPAVPRPLDAAVPTAPVVVSRSALAASKPEPAAKPDVPADGTLEAWVRSLKQPSQAA